MGNPILNSQAVLLCPHGAPITHVPGTFTSYRVNGYPPLLFTDQYLVSGCPFTIGSMGMACQRVQWVSPSTMLFVKGVPVLTSASIGLCIGQSGAPNGPAVIASFQVAIQEPDSPTFIDQ